MLNESDLQQFLARKTTENAVEIASLKQEMDLETELNGRCSAAQIIKQSELMGRTKAFAEFTKFCLENSKAN